MIPNTARDVTPSMSESQQDLLIFQKSPAACASGKETPLALLIIPTLAHTSGAVEGTR
jgi:hypothetical protein